MGCAPTPGLLEIKRDHGRKTPDTKPPRCAGCRRWQGLRKTWSPGFCPHPGVVTTATTGPTAESPSSCSPPVLPASRICCPVPVFCLFQSPQCVLSSPTATSSSTTPSSRCCFLKRTFPSGFVSLSAARFLHWPSLLVLCTPPPSSAAPWLPD